MRVLQQVIGKTVEFGGQRPSRWFPSNASTPLPTPNEQLILDVRILEDEGGFILEWQCSNTDYSNDSWHATIEDAKNRALDHFGIVASDWFVVD